MKRLFAIVMAGGISVSQAGLADDYDASDVATGIALEDRAEVCPPMKEGDHWLLRKTMTNGPTANIDVTI
ncbi:MAG: hypothetical protein R3256_05720, partial [Thalassovita sp.]|nr:hypothetical protein [Thalassovita sp.]